jgi:hypothetical protein
MIATNLAVEGVLMAEIELVVALNPNRSYFG